MLYQCLPHCLSSKHTKYLNVLQIACFLSLLCSLFLKHFPFPHGNSLLHLLYFHVSLQGSLPQCPISKSLCIEPALQLSSYPGITPVWAMVSLLESLSHSTQISLRTRPCLFSSVFFFFPVFLALPSLGKEFNQD